MDVLHTGSWTAKAIEELKKIAQYRLAASTEAEKFTRVPRSNEITLAPDASYVAMCTNNTIEGTQWSQIPATGSVPLVADMSSDIASKPVDVRQFGLIFAGAQKNLGPAGATIVIVRRDLAERANDKIAKILQYRTHIKERSLYHTPSTFAIYTVGSGARMARGSRAAWPRSKNGTKPRRIFCTARLTPAGITGAPWSENRARR